MQWQHGLRFKIMWVILVSMLLMGGILSYLGHRETGNALNRKAAESARVFGEIVIHQIETRGVDLSMAMEALLNSRELVSAFAARDRDALAKLTTPFYKQRLEPQYKIDQFQFHLPPATSFLRAHKPEQFGDDLSAFRKTVVVANQTRKPVVGLEVGRGGPGLRVVYPVFHKSEPVGSVELGGSLTDIFAAARKTTGLEFAIGIRESVFRTAKRFADEKADVVVNDMIYYDFSDPQIRPLPVLAASAQSGATIEAQGKSWLASSFPLRDFSGQEIGAVLVLNDVSAMLADSRAATRNKILLIVLLSLGASVGLFAMIRLVVLVPVKQVVAVTERLARGDLTVALDQGRKDEFGVLFRAMETMVGQLRGLLTGIVEHAGQLTGSAAELNRVAEELTQGAGELRLKGETGLNFGSRLNADMSGVDGAVRAMAGYMNEVLCSAQEINDNMGTISAAAEQASASLGTVANSAGALSSGMSGVLGASERSSENMVQVALSVDAMNTSLAGVRERCSEAATVSEEARLAVEANGEVMVRLVDSVREVSTVVGLIQSIAEQTNMLALNAAIEAAGAGESGKGFAVVANEVKELARQTAHATGEIHGRIDQIQDHMEQVNRAMEGVNHRVHRIREVNGEILEAMVEQSRTVNEISGSMDAAAGETESVSRLVGEITREVEEVSRSVQEIALGIDEVTRNVSAASQGVDGMTRSVEKTSAHGEVIGSAVDGTMQRAGDLSGHMEEILASAERMRLISATVTQRAKVAEEIASVLDEELHQFHL
ncbi:MAG: methyl-accepting chemotaxis protein [Magnetococcales bacterium]|nr:methyl-accepting chemotaxis protein [Magnetococcales bacterium]